jgi:hypothetical protein
MICQDRLGTNQTQGDLRTKSMMLDTVSFSLLTKTRHQGPNPAECTGRHLQYDPRATATRRSWIAPRLD